MRAKTLIGAIDYLLGGPAPASGRPSLASREEPDCDSAG